MIAVLQHIHYPDQLGYLIDKILNIPEDYDLFVNVTDVNNLGDVKFKILDLIRLSPESNKKPSNIYFFQNPNVGMDVMGNFLLMEEVIKLKHLKTYDLFIKLGTELDAWQRHSLIEPLLRDKETAQKIINMFKDSDDVGMIGSSEEFCLHEMISIEKMRHLEKIYKVESLPTQFFKGTMFWIRGEIFYRMSEAYPSPYHLWDNWQCQMCGNYEHAYERFYGTYTRALGYKIVKV